MEGFCYSTDVTKTDNISRGGLRAISRQVKSLRLQKRSWNHNEENSTHRLKGQISSGS